MRNPSDRSAASSVEVEEDAERNKRYNEKLDELIKNLKGNVKNDPRFVANATLVTTPNKSSVSRDSRERRPVGVFSG